MRAIPLLGAQIAGPVLSPVPPIKHCPCSFFSVRDICMATQNASKTSRFFGFSNYKHRRIISFGICCGQPCQPYLAGFLPGGCHLKFLMLSSSAYFIAFFFNIWPLIGIASSLTLTNHLYKALSNLVWLLLSFCCLWLSPPSKALNIFSLFFIHVESVFSGML